MLIWGSRGAPAKKIFEGVSVTAVILAPGACGRGLQAALLATTFVTPVTPATSVTSSKNANIAAVRVTSELATSSDTSGRSGGADFQ